MNPHPLMQYQTIHIVFSGVHQILFIVTLRLSGEITGHFTNLEFWKQQYFLPAGMVTA